MHVASRTPTTSSFLDMIRHSYDRITRIGFGRSEAPLRILESSQLTILTTDTCTAACAHCCMGSSPQRKAKLNFENIKTWIDQIAEKTTIRTIIFAGGEPLLLGEDIFAAIEYVRERCLKSRLVTNAYWAISDDRASAVCKRLLDAGLDELNISIDDFHIPYVDPQKVRNAFLAARQMDFQSVIVVHCTGPTTKFNAQELDQLLGERIPRLFDDECERIYRDTPGQRPFVAISNTVLQAVGRGGQSLSAGDIYLDDRWEKRSRQIGGCPWAVQSPAITPGGHLVSCCGFEVAGNEILDIGDLSTHSVPDLLDKADQDLPLNWIALEGPYAIMDFLRTLQPELPFRERYGSYCELCEHIVTEPVLVKAFKEGMAQRAFSLLDKRESMKQAAEEAALFELEYQIGREETRALLTHDTIVEGESNGAMAT
jgi:organic radical activating enzyme